MAITALLPTTSTSKHHHQTPKRKKKHQPLQPKQPSPWEQIKSLLTCKEIEGSRVHDPSKNGYSKLGSSCTSLCSFRDVVHGNTRVMHKDENSPESSTLGREMGRFGRSAVAGSTRSTVSIRSNGSGASGGYANSRGMQLRKLSGCYECHYIVDPGRYPSPRTTICACSQCGEVFTKAENLEIHQAVRHAVSELGPEDSGRNIVEIIFKSSWLKKDSPICKIERILKVHNSQRTIGRFEDSRDAVKARANNANNPSRQTKKNPRCAADGNELLRFHCTTLTCALGARRSSTLCGSVPGCGVCTIIRYGFAGKGHDSGKGVCTTASSGRAHDSLEGTDGKRAMLVCRVIAGRIKRGPEDTAAVQPGDEAVSAGSYDSVAGYSGIYSNLEELFVYNPRAILPCFVVIYRAQDEQLEWRH